MSEGKAFGGNVYTILSDPDDASNVWMSASPDQRGDQTLLYSNDYGQSWTPSSTTISNTPDVYGLSIATSSSTQSKVLYVTIAGQIYQSTNPKDTNGATWTDLQNSLCSSGCRVTAADDSGNVYAGGESGLFYSQDEGQSWTAFTGISSFASQSYFHSSSWRGVSDIKVDPHSSGTVLVSVFQSVNNNGDNKGGVYECSVQSQTCTQLLGDPQTNQSAPFVRNLEVNPDNPDVIYVTSSAAYTGPSYYDNSLGVYRTKDRGLTWENISDGLAWPSAFPISMSSNDTEQLFIGSNGDGLHKKIIGADRVADYRDDFSATDWSYQTNTLSGLSNPSSNVALSPNGDTYYTATTGDYGELSDIGGHTGFGIDESGTDNYVIAGYTIPNTGTYFLKDGFVEFQKTSCSQWSNGGNLKIYKHSDPTTLLTDVDITNESAFVIDMELGQINAGDKIYVAVGPKETDGCDGFLMDYSIEYKNYPPEITNPGMQTSTIGSSDSFQIVASDPENDTLTYSANNLPTGMSINTSTGEITGTPTTLGTVYPTVAVSDASHSRSTSFEWIVSEANSSGIANYHDDFSSSSNPNGQWRYLWNENGAIGNSGNYSPLEWKSYRYTKYQSNGNGPVDAMLYASLTSTGGHPGRGTDDGQSTDRYVIVAYDITQTGFYEIVDSEFDANLASWEINNPNQGQDIRIYVNNTLKQSIQRVDVSNFDFDLTLGVLNAGDTVYVAFGPKGSDGNDGFDFDFSIQETTLTTVASFQSDYQTPSPASQWTYQWSNDGNVDSVSNWAPLSYRDNWAYFRNTTDGFPSQSAFRYGMLNGTGGHAPGASGQTYPDGSGYITNDQYVIATYTTDSAGDFHLINSEITFGSSGSDGGEVRVYVDSQLVYSTNVTQQNLTPFDVDLGALNAGQDISVAVGPGGSDGADGFTMDFDIAK